MAIYVRQNEDSTGDLHRALQNIADPAQGQLNSKVLKTCMHFSLVDCGEHSMIGT